METNREAYSIASRAVIRHDRGRLAAGWRGPHGRHLLEDRQGAERRKPRSVVDLVTILLASGAIALVWRSLGVG